MKRCMHLTAGTVLVLLATFSTSSVRADGAPVDFGRQIRPLLAQKCFQCHGLDAELRETDLRLDTREGLFAEIDSGGHAVVPGKLDESVLYERLVSKSADELMPPPDSEKSLTKEEIDLFRRWIAQGAKWEQHWSLVAPLRATPPKVKAESRVRNEIDRFIFSRLEKEGLSPSSSADKETLIRRVTLDLTGLPPTVQEVDAFLADVSPQAYEKVVERLLDSPHYGEHMGRYWLDAARYGDTHGLHLDNLRRMWPYREWVIKAFNKNMSFDQFTIEQLAGDLLPNPTLDQKIATGFNRCNVTTSEGGVIPEEYHVHYTNDRVATMSTVWMGLSMGCVTCHEHKFDPYEMKDFYQLSAFFNNLDGPVMDGNKPLPAPIVQVPNPVNQPEIDRLAATIAALKTKLDVRANAAGEEFAAWTTAMREKGDRESLLPSAKLVGYWRFDEAEGRAVSNSVEGTTPGSLRKAERIKGKFGGACKVGGDQFVELGDVGGFDRTDAFSYGCWVNAQPGNGGSAVIARMDDANSHRGYDMYVSDGRVYAHIIHSWPGDTIKVESKDKFELKKWQHLLVTYDGSGKAAGVAVYINGKASKLTVRNDNLKGTIKTDVPLQIGRRSSGSPFNGSVDDVRIYGRALSAAEAADLAGNGEIHAILALADKDRDEKQQQTLRTYYLTNHDAAYQQLSGETAAVEHEKRELEARDRIESLIWRDAAKPKPTYILIRGAYDKPGELVTRNTPAALPPLPPMKEGEIPTRLTLANWLLSAEHPLTSRVIVSRYWAQYFGVGIVETAEDFGSQGSGPSHPKLLDWLAVEFRESGWDVKRLQKTIVMSATYQQSAKISPEALKKDPNNKLYSRGPRFRLDAEVIRDTALAVSGLLVRKIGGPSVKPYQPAGIWKAVGYTDSNTANFARDTGEALYRRSLYTFWKRTAPPPTLVSLDAPSRENCTVRRSRTNTPMAALALMNDEQFVEASRHLAQRIMTEGGKTDAERIAYAFRLANARQPSRAEFVVLLDVYKSSYAKFGQDVEAATKLISVGESKPNPALDAGQLAAWTMVANLILNLDETITKG